ncbi:MAG: DNA polymerase III subunit gamma/tau [Cytophagales bacterium]|nr:DNA polymerase III subunit gamma/tau [Cytophagales bacterium]
MKGSFLASARKYRPLDFEQVLGQSHVTQTLENALKQDQLAQALLFTGPRGVGKTTCARILAHRVNGIRPRVGEPPSSLNIFELDAASHNSVEDIRSLTEQVRIPPQGDGTRKVYIIDEVHMLSLQAFNAFLKTLEEPPSYVIFILATTEKNKVLPTILSRCQIFDFKRIRRESIVLHLQKISEEEQVVAEEDALHAIAQRAEGSLRDALSLYDMLVTFSPNKHLSYQQLSDTLSLCDHDFYLQLIDRLYEGDYNSSLLSWNEAFERGMDLLSLINDLAENLRHLLLAQTKEALNLLPMGVENREKYASSARSYSNAFLLEALNLCATCEQGYKQAKHPLLWTEITLLQISHLNKKAKVSTTSTPSDTPKPLPTPIAEKESPPREGKPKEPITPPLRIHKASTDPSSPPTKEFKKEKDDRSPSSPSAKDKLEDLKGKYPDADVEGLKRLL